MNHIDERMLALLDSGDVDAQTAAAAESHLSECPSCQALSANFAANGRWLQSLGTEPGADELAMLTAGTLSRIEARRQPQKLWLAASSVAAALVLGALVFAWRPRTPVAEPPTVAQISPPPAAHAAPPAPKVAQVEQSVRRVRAKIRARPHRPRLESVSLISQKDAPPILKMNTNDPNVVILWVMNGNSPQPEINHE